MHLDRLDADIEDLRDLLVAMALGHQLHDTAFPAGQRLIELLRMRQKGFEQTLARLWLAKYGSQAASDWTAEIKCSPVSDFST